MIQRNPVCTVEFCGFTATTLELEQSGWQFSAQQDPHRSTVRLALHHPRAGLSGLTNECDMSAWLHAATRDAVLLKGHVFRVCSMGSNTRVQYITMSGNTRPWSAVSMFPDMIESPLKELDLHELVPFRAVNHEAEQIVIAPESVTQVLDLLLKCQAPAAAARRVAERQRGVRRAADIQAQVLVEVA